MEKSILRFLSKNWKADYVSKIQFSPVPKGQKGDLAAAFFVLTKEFKKTPPEIASEVAKILTKCPEIEKTEIVGPYLNLFFSNEVFFNKVLEAPLVSNFLADKKIIVEFSSPNTNKPLHLGHMRNHALGISLSNLLEAVGAKVFRLAIFNDRGVHICKSMLAYQKYGNDETPESKGQKSDHFVGDYYVKFDIESKKDPKMGEEAQKMLVEWENENPEVLALWKIMNEWAFAGYHKTYARQGIKFNKEYFESDLYKFGKEYVMEGLKKGILKKKDGAIIIDLTDDGLDEKVLLRSNGTAVYMTQDLATTLIKQKEFNPDQQIWIVADEQNYHFKVLFLCLEKLKLLKPENLFHLSYGLVNLPEGRMKSREGTVVDADELMDELSDLALVAIKKRNPETPVKEAKIIAEQIMNAAWKFYLLTTSPRKAITFEPQKSIAFEGSTGPYLQYAGVRLKSIFRKAETELPPCQGGIAIGSEVAQARGEGGFEHQLGEPEKPLGVKILEYDKVLNRAAETKNPTYVVTYLLELAQVWSSYYAEHSVLNAETEELKLARLVLAKKVFEVLEAGLGVLGIEVPEKM